MSVPVRRAAIAAACSLASAAIQAQPEALQRELDTVPTPGENDRGARRLVCGGQPRTSTADCYYTADHYDSFRRVQP